jgi:hypothetical protein
MNSSDKTHKPAGFISVRRIARNASNAEHACGGQGFQAEAYLKGPLRSETCEKRCSWEKDPF